MTESGNETRKRIRAYVVDTLAPGKGVPSVADDDSLVESGIVDSLGIFQLVSFLEDTFRIRIGDEEIIHENFLTVAAIDRFVRAKLGPTGRSALAS